MDKRTIVKRDAGQQLPTEYKAKLLSEHPTGFGLAVVDDSFLTIDWADGRQYDLATTLDRYDVAYKDNTVIYSFIGMDNFTDDDIQPFAILESEDEETKKKENVLAAFIAGDFIGTEASADLPTICVDAYNDAEDLPKMWDLIEKPTFRNSMKGILQPSGVALLICNDSSLRPKLFQNKNDKQIEYSFGWASDSLGWAEAPPKPEEPAKPTKAAVVAAAKKVRVVPEVKAPVPEAAKPKEEVKPPPAEKPAMIAVPSGLLDRPRRRWIKKNFVKTFVSSLDATDAAINALKELPAKMLRPDSALYMGVRQLTPENVRAALESKNSEAGPVVPPIIPSEQLKKVQELIRNTNFVDPVYLSTLEDKHDLASEQLAIDGVRDIIRLDPKILRKICTEMSQTAYCMIIELCIELKNLNPSLLEPSKEEEEEQEEKEAVAEQPKVSTKAAAIAAAKARKA